MKLAVLVVAAALCVVCAAEKQERAPQPIGIGSLAALAQPAPVFLELSEDEDKDQDQAAKVQAPSPFAFPMNWNPYAATLQHPFQLGNFMMGPGMGGFPFPYHGYYPYFNPHPFLATPHTPPSPFGDPL